MGRSVKSINQLKLYLESNKIIDPVTNCWLWDGALSTQGYGKLIWNKKDRLIHRLSAYIYLEFNLNSKLQINHKDQCPNRHCFNPEHIYIGTHIDNMNDFKRNNPYCKICGGLKSQVHRRINGYTTRECGYCMRMNQKKYKANKRLSEIKP